MTALRNVRELPLRVGSRSSGGKMGSDSISPKEIAARLRSQPEYDAFVPQPEPDQTQRRDGDETIEHTTEEPVDAAPFEKITCNQPALDPEHGGDEWLQTGFAVQFVADEDGDAGQQHEPQPGEGQHAVGGLGGGRGAAHVRPECRRRRTGRAR